MNFDAQAELAALQKQTQIIRKKRYTSSRLDRYKGEILTLHKAGASVAELQRWLQTRRIKVVHSTVARWVAKHG